MKDRKPSILLLMLLLIGVGIFSSLTDTFSLFSKFLFFALSTFAIGIVLIVAIVMFFAFEKSEKKGTSNNNMILREGRMILVELRNACIKILDNEIKRGCEEACEVVGQIFKNIHQQKDSVQKIRKLITVYLPAFKTIINKYVLLESANQVDQQLRNNMISYLRNLRDALNTMNASLFDDDKLDLTVELKTLMAVCQKDGLISSNEYCEEDNRNSVQLKL